MFEEFILSFLVSLTLAGCAFAGNDESDIPLAVDELVVGRVDNALMRVVHFNTLVEQKMYVELIKTPRLSLLDRKIITSIKLGDELLDFSKAALVFLENIKIHDSQADFDLTFQWEGRHGEYHANCFVKAENSKLTEPVCKQVLD